MFEAVRGTSYMSDIAIDEITLSFGLCKQGNIWIIYSIAVFNAENFDNNFCYYSGKRAKTPLFDYSVSQGSVSAKFWQKMSYKDCCKL